VSIRPSLLTTLLVLSFLVPPDWLERGPTLCLAKLLTGRRCPGCGITRAVVALSHGQLRVALRHHRLSQLVYVVLWWLVLRDRGAALAARSVRSAF
jgi:hypothetical protein